MFSLRRKPKHVHEQPKVRPSPSLPEVHKQGIPWPENLVDVNSIRNDQDQLNGRRVEGATKTSLQGPPNHPIPFHKPFRPSSGSTVTSANGGGLISSLYMSNSPSAFDNWKNSPAPIPRYSQRRAKLPPTFNVMVVGGIGTGKTSLLRLILETAELSPSATVDQKLAVERFLRGATKTTHSIETASIEICESRFDRLLLSVVDTPGLDYAEGRELKLDRQVSSVMQYLDAQYADTMSEESKVVRKSKGDQHVHLCIYMIEPSSIMTMADRRARSSLPVKTRSETSISQSKQPELIPDTSSDSDSEEGEEKRSPLTMSPAELRVIRRLSTRCNVLPVVAKADSLTDEKLVAVKEAVRRSLAGAGLDFGVFGPSSKTEKNLSKIRSGNGRKTHFAVGSGNSDQNEKNDSDDDNRSGVEDERQSRPVIKLRPPRHPTRNLSRSRSRRDLSQAAADERLPSSLDLDDRDSVANVRFSAHIVARPDISAVLPFALIAPVSGRPRRTLLETEPTSPMQQSEDGNVSETIPPTPGSVNHAYLNGPPEDLRGVFVRNYRWGTIDVLDPNHCDFAAMRTAVLSTHLKVLKTHTNEVLYEKYRTEKLLARRATSHITDDERKRLLEDLGL
ncbi:hypothetical protein E1B28_012402 [Marasmius oreades]|uniref:Septin-type G domain-containing protein n=1 Tax=Marasmius oreades TaxID=181124 RepID=A0A9P7RS82_9AGAR|nr:uncharacterized protein E1B28_012402 [Marasmius oreades]KAG7088405.1 hypothetical protein E1B28_012402 [Marasmius oreades]